jgi:hypothetical protein
MLELIPAESDSKKNRLARSKMKLSEILHKSNEYREAEKLREQAIEHLTDPSNKTREQGGIVDFNKLVPHIDR